MSAYNDDIIILIIRTLIWSILTIISFIILNIIASTSDATVDLTKITILKLNEIVNI